MLKLYEKEVSTEQYILTQIAIGTTIFTNILRIRYIVAAPCAPLRLETKVIADIKVWFLESTIRFLM